MPSKAQATQLPTFGAFKKFETHMPNRLSSEAKGLQEGVPEGLR